MRSVSESINGAQAQALALVSAVDEQDLVRGGRMESEVGHDIVALAETEFGVARRWHRDIVRSGPNTLSTFDMPIVDRRLGSDETVFLDLGPVFGTAEADVGRTFVLGSDPEKHRLVADLPIIFSELSEMFHADETISGAELYAEASRRSADRGWDFAGKIAGHIVGEFPHAGWAGRDKSLYIRPDNDAPLANADDQGRPFHWIIEVHIASPCGSFGGFYEQLA